MDIEKIAVNTVDLAISKSDYLVSNIHKGDREPSWDGDIEVYTKAGSNHRKEDLVIRIPVQVKGMSSDHLKKKTIKYPIQVADMKNYLQAGGTVYFVVLMSASGESTQIYYVELLPFELKKVLAKHGNQQTRNMTLKVLPNKKDEMTNIFLSFGRDMKRQLPAISAEPVTIEELAKAGQLKEINIGFTSVPRTDDETPFDYLFDHGAYIYAKLPFGVELPVEHLENIEAAGTTVNAVVTANGKQFYDKYEVTYKKDTIELTYGKSITRIINRKNKSEQKLTFTPSGTLSDHICDLDFIISAFTNNQFEIGEDIYPLKGIKPEDREAFDLSGRQKQLEWLLAVQETLNKLDVTEELDYSNLTPKDERGIQLLKSAILDNEAVNLNDPKNLFGYINIANLNILICVKKVEGTDNLFNIYNYMDAAVDIKCGDENEKYPSTVFALFKTEDFLKCSNINYKKLLDCIKNISYSDCFSGQAVGILLNMLRAYDASNPPRKHILDTAKELSEWLKDNDPFTPTDILSLNCYQVIKRMRAFNDAEIRGLTEIIENSPDKEEIYVGAYLLLDNQEAADLHFRNMDEDTQKAFREYPIYKFRKNEIANIVEELPLCT